jgi:hypothetical protein
MDQTRSVWDATITVEVIEDAQTPVTDELDAGNAMQSPSLDARNSAAPSSDAGSYEIIMTDPDFSFCR